MKISYKNKTEELKINNIVYTYYEDFGWGRHWMLDAWEKSWKKNGWETKILGLEDAKKHPKYKEVLAKINTMPTTNDRRYENACYLRWVAMACIGGLMTDMDVINICYKPEDKNYKNENDKKMILFSKGYVPCMVRSEMVLYEEVIKWIFLWDGRTSEKVHNNRHHVSDMVFFQFFYKDNISIVPYCYEYYDNKDLGACSHCKYSSFENEKKRKEIITGLSNL